MRVASRVHRVHLHSAGLSSTPFPWAELGPDALEHACAHADLLLSDVARRGSRWVAVLTRREVAT